MHKNAYILLILTAMIAVAIFVWPGLFEQTKVPDELLIILSTDGPLLPGKRQELIVYTLNNTDFLPWQKSEFIARLEVTDKNNQGRIIAQASSETTNPLKFLCEIPNNFSAKNITFNLYQKSNPATPVFSQQLKVQKDISIIAAPPDEQVYCDSWLSTRVFAFSRRNLNGIYRVPLRVKMITPFKQTTLNRIIHTDTHGFAWFSTFISNKAPAGIYRLEFSHGSESLALEIPILAKSSRAKTRLTNFAAGLNHLSAKNLGKQKKQNFSINNLEADTLITALKLGNQQLNFNFNCPSSELRCLEVWQNGKLLNHDFLPIEQGRSAHPLPRSTFPDEPLRLKLWFISNNELAFATTALHDVKPKKSFPMPIISMLKKRLSISEKKLFSLFTGKKMPVYARNLTIGHKPDQLAEITISPAKSYRMAADDKPQQYRNSRLLFQNRPASVANRFFLVESELNLAKYNFSSLKIHLDAKNFYRNLLATIRNNQHGMMSILAEIEIRIARFNLLPLQDQKAEIEILEGLLIPVAEFIKFASLENGTDQAELKRTRRILQSLKRFIYLPDELRLMLSNISEARKSIGPVPEVFESQVNEEVLNAALQPGGKILLQNQNKKFSANLSRNLSSFKNIDTSGKRKLLKKLVNLRTDPIIVELIFND